MIYELIAIVFLTLSLFFIFGYFIVALINERRIGRVREITERGQFLHDFISQRPNMREGKNYGEKSHPEYEKEDLLSMVTVSDYTTDHTIRKNIKKGVEILLEKKRD